MRFGISYLGVDRHTALLEEECRRAGELEELLRQSCLLSQCDPLADAASLGKCADAVERVARSIRWRIQFLGELNDRMQRNGERIQEMIRELEEALR